MSQKKTLQPSKNICENDYDHTNAIVKWGFNEQNEWDGILFGCSRCEVEPQPERFPDKPQEIIDHAKCEYDPCFNCKANGLQFGTGDAGRSVSGKKWDSELQAYRDARAQGIQPAGTTRAHIEQAYKASEALGKAYSADTMPKAKDINKRTAEVLKHVGMV